MLHIVTLGLQSIFVVQPGLFSLAMDLMLALQLQISGNWGLSLNVTQQFMNI